jgi:hypothetical protein
MASLKNLFLFNKKHIFLGCSHPFLLASMGLGFVFILAFIAILACLITTRIRRRFRRRLSQTQSHAWGHSGPSRPHAGHIMLRDELTQKFSHFDKITVFGYPRACRFRKHHIENRLPSGPSLYQLCSKRDFYFIKCG